MSGWPSGVRPGVHVCATPAGSTAHIAATSAIATQIPRCGAHVMASPPCARFYCVPPADAPVQTRDSRLPAPDLRRLEVNLDAEDDFRPALDLARRQIDPLGNFLNVLVDDRMVAALRKQIDQ